MAFSIVHTTTADLGNIYSFFDASVLYQQAHAYPDWRNYDRNVILNDIRNKTQYKLITEGEMALVFSVCYSDPLIWGETDKADALYIHRMVVNPSHKGKRLFEHVLDWCVEQCKQAGLHFVRMDTWADNPALIKYYQSFGFSRVRHVTTPNSAALPAHNRGLALALLSFELHKAEEQKDLLGG